MKDGQWEDWTEPLEFLLAKAKEFIDTIKRVSSSLQELPEGGKLIEPPEIFKRTEELGNALAAFVMFDERIQSKFQRLKKVLKDFPGLYDKQILDAADKRKIWTVYFLRNYIYATSVYEDVYALVFEYMGENEHAVGLHDSDEFAQTKQALLEDFALYAGNWQSPHIKDKR